MVMEFSRGSTIDGWRSCLWRRKLPLIDLRGRVAGLRIPIVGLDNRPVARLAFEHLRDREFRDYGFCGLPPGARDARTKPESGDPARSNGTCARVAARNGSDAQRRRETVRLWKREVLWRCLSTADRHHARRVSPSSTRARPHQLLSSPMCRRRASPQR